MLQVYLMILKHEAMWSSQRSQRKLVCSHLIPPVNGHSVQIPKRPQPSSAARHALTHAHACTCPTEHSQAGPLQGSPTGQRSGPDLSMGQFCWLSEEVYILRHH